MSVAQQISKLVSLNAKGLLDDEELAFAIRELRGAASEEKKVPAVTKANLKRARDAARAIMAAVRAPAPAKPAVAKKRGKRPKTVQAAADDWERFLDETLEGAKRYDAEHNADIRPEGLEGALGSLFDDKYAEVKRDDVKYEQGAYYCVEFRVQLMDEERKANDELIRAYANTISKKMVRTLNHFHKTGTTFKLDDSKGSMAIYKAFKWEQWAMNHFSAGGDVTVEKFGACAPHEIGAWDSWNEKLTRHGIIQPTIGELGGQFVKGGDPISRPEFYRENSCMLNLFLEWVARPINRIDTSTVEGQIKQRREILTPARRRLNSHLELLNHASLFRLATGQELVDGEPAGVSLREAEKWLEKWCLSGRAINKAGELVWRYDPPSRDTSVVGGAVWRLLVHDEHVWLCNTNKKAFNAKYGGKEVEPPKVDNSPDISKEVSEKWRRAPPPSGQPLEIVTDVQSVLATPETSEEAMTNGNPEKLALALMASGYEPGFISCEMGKIETFSVRLPTGREVRIRRAVEVQGDQSTFAEALTKRGQIVFEAYLARIRACYMPIDGLSTYSKSLFDMFDKNSRGPRCGLLKPWAGGKVVGFDIGRAYTWHLSDIEKIPVFSVFDTLVPCPKDVVVSPLSWYRVYIPKLDRILFPLGYDFVAGEEIEFARSEGIEVEIRAVVVPCRLIRTGGRAALQEMYRDSELDNICVQRGDKVADARKNIPNIVYGLTNKKRNTKQVASLFRSKEEALGFSPLVSKLEMGSDDSDQYEWSLAPGQALRATEDEDGRTRISVTNENAECVWMATKQGQKNLTEGYLPVARLVLGKMRRMLYRMVKAVGGLALGVRTDCVYVAAEHEAEARALLLADGFRFGGAGWEAVGALKTEHKDDIGMSELLEIRNQLPHGFPEEQKASYEPYNIEPEPICERFELKDELATTMDDWTEVDALMPTRAIDHAGYWLASQLVKTEEESLECYERFHGGPNMLDPRPEPRGPLAIEADVPGAGKTYLVKRWLERTGQKSTSIIVCPWNPLVADCIADGFVSMTLHTLLGKLAMEETAKIEKRPYNCAGVTHIHFEEVYLYPVRQLGWMKKFMTTHKWISFTAAGDPGQLEPVNQCLAVDSDSWYESAFAQMFPRRLTLKVSKRCTGEDRVRMHNLCNALKDTTKSVKKSLKAARLREVDFAALTELDAAYPHIAATGSTLVRVDNWAHEIAGDSFRGEFLPGQKLLGVGGTRCKGGRIHSNMPYTVKEVTDTHLTVTAQDEKARTLTLESATKFLKRPYCMTGHATQGLSLGARIYVHDWGTHMATHRWIRTVMSRCGTLDIILVNGSEGVRGRQADINMRVEGHKMADRNKFTWNDKEYITTEWVRKQLKKQRWSCYSCGDPLDVDWSVDRIDNKLPHLIDNCAISCRRCQNGSSHRPTFKPTKLVVAPPKVTYKFTPSTYENRADWINEPCALGRKKCKGGLDCHHCGGTPRGDWRNATAEVDTSMYD